ncbi:addiction module toxin, RelE/StbE family [Lacticaseibacillus rhamnosus ATCC 21052]|jgi:mRNA interferase YafQ|nr:addiction module toxin, RelE/StbE family [Lacticaseibacillus rhamnosus ATCC 21052]
MYISNFETVNWKVILSVAELTIAQLLFFTSSPLAVLLTQTFRKVPTMPTSLPLIEQSRFKKHLKQLLQAGRFTKADFQQVLAYLQTSTPLPEKYDDHVIKKRKPDRALFIKGNWLLIYRVEPDAIRLIDVGRHGET